MVLEQILLPTMQLLDKNTLTEDMLQVPKFSDDNRETRTEIVSVDDELYKKLCDRAGAEYGSILLLNTLPI